MIKEVTIIIATYNASSCLSRCLDSIISQKTEKVELIIVDGGSSDGTIKVIKQYEPYIDKWISESDKGLYDAWNKGITLSSGRWIQFIGADDTYVEGALSDYLSFIQRVDYTYIDFIAAKVFLYTSSGRALGSKGRAYMWDEFKYVMTIAHPSVLHSRNLFKEVGMFDIKYKSSADYELFYRNGSNMKALFFDKNVVNFYLGGTSFSLFGLKETCQIQAVYNQISWVVRKYLLVKGAITLFLKKTFFNW